jgi:hypothetical protein
MIHADEFGLDLFGPESSTSQETDNRALLELAYRVRCPFNIRDDASAQRVCGVGNRKIVRWMRH